MRSITEEHERDGVKLMMDAYHEFQWRGLIHTATPQLKEALARDSLTCYIGFDPSASSLHVGSLLPILALARLQRLGHSPIAVVGGFTGLIGDPSGKTAERPLMDLSAVQDNIEQLTAQLSRFLDMSRPPNAAEIVNNADWLEKIPLKNFLRDIGKYFTVNYMLAKESVKRRLEHEEGISYTEFSYLLLQAYDYLWLYENKRCRLQLGGSDQWGNITAGCDLIQRLHGRSRGAAGEALAHGLVLPLVTTASGVKFGKTEAGTVWLDAGRTSPFRFYQFWFNTDDRDVLDYLKYFTFLPEADISQLESTMRGAPEQRVPQRTLAREVTELVHGRDGMGRAERASHLVFSERISELNVDDVLTVFDEVPSTEMNPQGWGSGGISLPDLLAKVALVPSKSEATRLIKSGGIYVNNRRVTDAAARITVNDAIAGRLLVLRKGQRQNHLVKLTENPGLETEA